jgi:hypothetical protein
MEKSPSGELRERIQAGRRPRFAEILERETGFEPATSTLARSHSTTELLPLGRVDYSEAVKLQQCAAQGKTFTSAENLDT